MPRLMVSQPLVDTHRWQLFIESMNGPSSAEEVSGMVMNFSPVSGSITVVVAAADFHSPCTTLWQTAGLSPDMVYGSTVAHCGRALNERSEPAAMRGDARAAQRRAVWRIIVRRGAREGRKMRWSRGGGDGRRARACDLPGPTRALFEICPVVCTIDY